MISPVRPALFALLAASLALTVQAADDSFRAPDSLVLKDGSTVRGLIVKNTASAVTLQQEFGETVFPKSEIVRIRDEADIAAVFTEMLDRGDLPSWRVIANDLRLNDAIKSVVQIPATAIDNGIFKNVPYLSFRVNDYLELNIYGDPNDPAAIEMGIYGRHSGNTEARSTLRSYLSGFLTSRAEVAALYGLGLEEGTARAGRLTFRVSPRTAPDSYGAWWIAIYNEKDLNEVRIDDARYAKLTKPFDEVVDRRGKVTAKGWTDADLQTSERLEAAGEGRRVILRGFYRDKSGQFRVLGPDGETVQ